MDILYPATHICVGVRSASHTLFPLLALDTRQWSVCFCCVFNLCPPSLSVSFHLPLAYHTYVSLKSPHPSSSPPLTHSCDTKHIIMNVCQTLAASFSVWTHDSCLLFFEQIYSRLNWEFFSQRCVNVCIFSCLSNWSLITNTWLPTFSTCYLVSSNKVKQLRVSDCRSNQVQKQGISAWVLDQYERLVLAHVGFFSSKLNSKQRALSALWSTAG